MRQTDTELSLIGLAFLLHNDGRLDVAKEAASRAAHLSGGRERQTSNRVLDEGGKAISHFEVVPGIASFGRRYHLFWTRHSLANLFRFEDALMALVVQ